MIKHNLFISSDEKMKISGISIQFISKHNFIMLI